MYTSPDRAFDARTSPLRKYHHLRKYTFQIHFFDYRSSRLHSENHLEHYLEIAYSMTTGIKNLEMGLTGNGINWKWEISNCLWCHLFC